MREGRLREGERDRDSLRGGKERERERERERGWGKGGKERGNEKGTVKERE